MSREAEDSDELSPLATGERAAEDGALLSGASRWSRTTIRVVRVLVATAVLVAAVYGAHAIAKLVGVSDGLGGGDDGSSDRFHFSSRAETSRVPPVPKPSFAELQENSTFDPECGHRGKLSECPGFAMCLRTTDGHDDAHFVAKMRERRELPLEPIVPRCTQATCLDRSRCAPPFKVYVYRAEEVSHALQQCINEPTFDEEMRRKYVTDDPERACVFWFEKPGRCPRLAAFRGLPHWGKDGLNNFIADRGDKGTTAEERAHYLGRATMAMGHATYERFVPRLDIAISLRGGRALPKAEKLLQGTAPWGRKWLLTFKGTYSHPARRKALALHDESRRVVIAGYPHFHNCDSTTSPGRPRRNQGKIEVPPLHADCCRKMRELYNSYNFIDLMNSTFALVLPGRQPASYRLPEVMAAGSIPVFFGFEGAFRPYEEVIDWPAISLFVAADVEPEVLLGTLERLARDRAKVAAMQRAGAAVYREYIGSEGSDKSNRAILETLRRRFEFEDRRRLSERGAANGTTRTGAAEGAEGASSAGRAAGDARSSESASRWQRVWRTTYS